ncbi:carbohydrate ABC transporter permease [Rhodocaloribacter litoris]|uniref:carbohydrate ABC transporter permease n=1 Tax=Rhodocaloribacter litoris TaxID=2558931 RepID=UPI00141E77C3|nr:carbohydrate ABC transporter permease [Rhodocaloribacter litoris]QXD15125.1 carbohydrate ABC transporter permease [Rhodocaloribacter litoris]
MYQPPATRTGAWRGRLRLPAPGRVGVHLVLLLGAAVMVGPLVWMVLTSLKTPADAEAFFNTPRRLMAFLRALWPDPLTWDNYRAVFTERPLLRYFLNSAIYTGLRMVPALFFCSLAGFLFAKMKFPGRDGLFGAILLTMMIPFQVKMLVLYEMMVDFGWVDTYWAVVVVGLMEPFGIFLFRQTIKDIPDALLDAARIDGCGPLRIYFQVVLPLIRPALAAYAIFLFMWSWSDFLWPLIVINTETLKPVEVGILSFSDINNPDYVKMMAAATVAVAPIIVFFLFMQRQFIQGITMTGIKG